jgi:curved DNA-binding protein CbpA
MDEHGWQQDLADRARMEAQARAILAVEPGATSRELKQAFRDAARKHHPDRNPGDPDAEDRFRDAVAAYRFLVLAEPDRRLLGQRGPPARSTARGYNLDSNWGYFLWWRENFF